MGELEIDWCEGWEQAGGSADEANALCDLWFYTNTDSKEALVLSLPTVCSSASQLSILCSARFLEVYNLSQDVDTSNVVYVKTSRGVVKTPDHVYEHVVDLSSSQAPGVQLRFLSLQSADSLSGIPSCVSEAQRRVCLIKRISVSGLKSSPSSAHTSCVTESRAQTKPISETNHVSTVEPAHPPPPPSLELLSQVEKQMQSIFSSELQRIIAPLNQKLERLENKLDVLSVIVSTQGDLQKRQLSDIQSAMKRERSLLSSVAHLSLDQLHTETSVVADEAMQEKE